MGIIRPKPMKQLGSLRRRLSRWVGGPRSPLSAGWTQWGEERVLRLPVDAYATVDEIVIRAAVPGLGPEDLEVLLEGNTLTIQGRFPGPLPSVDYLVQERVSGPFRREIVINVPVRAGEAEARFEKGILMVILPKSDKVRSRTVEVNTTIVV